MRPVPLLALLLALAGCNAQQPAPADFSLTAPPAPASIRVTPPGFHMPEGGGCAGDSLRAEGLLHASKYRHGYPSGS